MSTHGHSISIICKFLKRKFFFFIIETPYSYKKYKNCQYLSSDFVKALCHYTCSRSRTYKGLFYSINLTSIVS